MAVKQRLVFRLAVLVVPDRDDTKNLRLPHLVQHKDSEYREFTSLEPDGDYRLGDVLNDMMKKAREVITENAKVSDLAVNQPTFKVLFTEFTLVNNGEVIGLDAGSFHPIHD